MEKKIRKIGKKAEEIRKKINRLNAEAELPSIELDIILGDIRMLYDKVREVQEIQSTNPAIDPTPADQSAGQVDTAPPQVESTPSPAVSTAQKVEDEQTGTTILADRYKGEKKLINESLAGNIEKNDIGSKIQSTPIRNINSVLGINDRFKLIRDLFNGDKKSFEGTISTLDAAANFNDAFSYINSTFDWDMEEDSVQMLLELVRRKFIVTQNE